jgi:hypothetical protein
MLISLNFALKSHPPKFAAGVPQLLGSGLPLLMFAGTSREAKYHTLMPVLVHKLAYTPPPLELKAVPYEVG